MICPYCKGTDFYEGPSGGMSVNILCSNPECRHWFNYLGIQDELEDLNRVEPSEEEKEIKHNKQVQQTLDAPNKFYQEGVELVKSGKSLIKAFYSTPEWHACHGGDLYRLAGYIDEKISCLNKKEAV